MSITEEHNQPKLSDKDMKGLRESIEKIGDWQKTITEELDDGHSICVTRLLIELADNIYTWHSYMNRTYVNPTLAAHINDAIGSLFGHPPKLEEEKKEEEPRGNYL